MAEALLKRVGEGFLPVPSANDPDAFKSVHAGETIRVVFTKPRNSKYHRKFFAMLNVGYEAFEPPEQVHKGLPVQKNFERFRKDVIISAGFYNVVANLKGEVRAEAHSISFGNMGEEEFTKLYNACCNVLLHRVLRNYTRDDLDRVVEELVRF